MNKVGFPILIVLLFLLAGIFIFVFQQVNSEKGDNKKEESSSNTEKEKIVDYLESSTINPNFGGEVFADYYKFGKEGNKLFIWAYISEYYKKEGKLKIGSGQSIPMVVSLLKNGNVKSQWEPREGEDYSQSIKEKFPEKYRTEALNFQSEKKQVINNLKEEVKSKAENELVNGKQERVISVGEVETIKLEANRSTGYKWHYRIGDENIIEVSSDEYKEDKHEEDVVGAGGKRILKLKGIKEGITTIKFKYSRGWESGEIEKSKEFKIKVKAEEEEAQFEVPENLSTEYISIKDGNVEIFKSKEEYPSGFNVKEDRIICKQETSEKMINAEKYCVKKSSEGAMGTIYKSYVYATVKNNSLITVSFTAGFPHCENYEERQNTECTKEKGVFNPDDIPKSVIADINP